jgi:hypothetical protein
MTFEEILDQAIAMLQRRGRLTYGTLKQQFQLDDAALDDLKDELIYGQRLAVDEEGRALVWTGGSAAVPLLADQFCFMGAYDQASAAAQRALTLATPVGRLFGKRRQTSAIWDSIAAEVEALEIPQSHKDELDRRPARRIELGRREAL